MQTDKGIQLNIKNYINGQQQRFNYSEIIGKTKIPNDDDLNKDYT